MWKAASVPLVWLWEIYCKFSIFIFFIAWTDTTGAISFFRGARHIPRPRWLHTVGIIAARPLWGEPPSTAIPSPDTFIHRSVAGRFAAGWSTRHKINSPEKVINCASSRLNMCLIKSYFGVIDSIEIFTGFAFRKLPISSMFRIPSFTVTLISFSSAVRAGL